MEVMCNEWTNGLYYESLPGPNIPREPKPGAVASGRITRMKPYYQDTACTIVVEHQGAVVVNRAWVSHRHNDIAMIEMDCKTKCGQVCAYMNGGLILGPSETSLHTHPTETGMTVVLFPEFEGWCVEMADYGRYTVRVCLTREPNDTPQPIE